jgi:hypothetical protein
VLHPATRVSGGRASTVRWEEIARHRGVELHGQTSWQELAPARSPSSPLWNQAPGTGSLPRAEATVLTDLLRPYTGDAEACTFAVWDGYGGSELDRQWSGAARLRVPGRTYVLLKGPIEAAATSFDVPGPGLGTAGQSANIWWPGDVAWCVATEVDHCWTYVGGAWQCIDQVLADPRLEALEVHCSDPASEPPLGG